MKLPLPIVIVASCVAHADEFRAARPDEPLAKEFSLARAASSLDASAKWWKEEHGCVQCHANMMNLVARPALAGIAATPHDTRELLESLVVGRWKEKGLRYPAEAVVVSVPMAFDDAQTTQRLHPLTREALDRMVSLQRADGSWQWVIGAPKSFVREFELTMFAALGIAVAPDGYANEEKPKLALDRVRKWAGRHPPTTAYGKGMLLWASSRVSGLQIDDERKRAAEELLALQSTDGGWAIENLIVGCKSHEDVTLDPSRASDGYGTGFVIFQACNAGIAADDARLQRGLAWLRANQRESGRWFLPSFNKRPNHVLSNSATAFAVLAFAACREPRTTPTQASVSRANPVVGNDRVPAGFTPLFDGKSWEQWNHEAHLNGVWEITNGVIRLCTDEPPRVKGKNYDLSTARKFRDFTLMIDWRLTGTPQVKPHQWLTDDGQFHTDAAGKVIMKDNLTWGDSGIYLRGARAAQVNIWCQPCGSGEVGTKFKDLTAAKEERMKTMPSIRADKGPGEWNRFIITLRGNRVDVSLNGTQVITGARVKDIPAEGPITLQNHKDAVEFRNVFIKELKP